MTGEFRAFVLVEGFLYLPGGLSRRVGPRFAIIQSYAPHPRAAKLLFSSQTNSLAMSTKILGREIVRPQRRKSRGPIDPLCRLDRLSLLGNEEFAAFEALDPLKIYAADFVGRDYATALRAEEC